MHFDIVLSYSVHASKVRHLQVNICYGRVHFSRVTFLSKLDPTHTQYLFCSAISDPHCQTACLWCMRLCVCCLCVPSLIAKL